MLATIIKVVVLLHHRIVTTLRKRMTPQQPQQSLQPPAQHAVTFDGLGGIFGASWNVAARRRKHRRNRPLVTSQHLQHNEFRELTHVDRLQALDFGLPELLFPASPASFSSITTKARRTSFTTSPKSMASNDFFGLMTTSALAAGTPQDRKAHV